MSFYFRWGLMSDSTISGGRMLENSPLYLGGLANGWFCNVVSLPRGGSVTNGATPSSLYSCWTYLTFFLTGKFHLPPYFPDSLTRFPDSLTHSGQYKRRATQVLQVEWKGCQSTHRLVNFFTLKSTTHKTQHATNYTLSGVFIC